MTEPQDLLEIPTTLDNCVQKFLSAINNSPDKFVQYAAIVELINYHMLNQKSYQSFIGDGEIFLNEISKLENVEQLKVNYDLVDESFQIFGNSWQTKLQKINDQLSVCKRAWELLQIRAMTTKRPLKGEEKKTKVTTLTTTKSNSITVNKSEELTILQESQEKLNYYKAVNKDNKEVELPSLFVIRNESDSNIDSFIAKSRIKVKAAVASIQSAVDSKFWELISTYLLTRSRQDLIHFEKMENWSEIMNAIRSIKGDNIGQFEKHLQTIKANVMAKKIPTAFSISETETQLLQQLTVCYKNFSQKIQQFMESTSLVQNKSPWLQTTLKLAEIHMLQYYHTSDKNTQIDSLLSFSRRGSRVFNNETFSITDIKEHNEQSSVTNISTTSSVNDKNKLTVGSSEIHRVSSHEQIVRITQNVSNKVFSESITPSKQKWADFHIGDHTSEMVNATKVNTTSTISQQNKQERWQELQKGTTQSKKSTKTTECGAQFEQIFEKSSIKKSTTMKSNNNQYVPIKLAESGAQETRFTSDIKIKYAPQQEIENTNSEYTIKLESKGVTQTTKLDIQDATSSYTLDTATVATKCQKQMISITQSTQEIPLVNQSHHTETIYKQSNVTVNNNKKCPIDDEESNFEYKTQMSNVSYKRMPEIQDSTNSYTVQHLDQKQNTEKHRIDVTQACQEIKLISQSHRTFIETKNSNVTYKKKIPVDNETSFLETNVKDATLKIGNLSKSNFVTYHEKISTEVSQAFLEKEFCGKNVRSNYKCRVENNGSHTETKYATINTKIGNLSKSNFVTYHEKISTEVSQAFLEKEFCGKNVHSNYKCRVENNGAHTETKYATINTKIGNLSNSSFVTYHQKIVTDISQACLEKTQLENKVISKFANEIDNNGSYVERMFNDAKTKIGKSQEVNHVTYHLEHEIKNSEANEEKEVLHQNVTSAFHYEIESKGIGRDMYYEEADVSTLNIPIVDNGVFRITVASNANTKISQQNCGESGAYHITQQKSIKLQSHLRVPQVEIAVGGDLTGPKADTSVQTYAQESKKPVVESGCLGIVTKEFEVSCRGTDMSADQTLCDTGVSATTRTVINEIIDKIETKPVYRPPIEVHDCGAESFIPILPKRIPSIKMRRRHQSATERVTSQLEETIRDLMITETEEPIKIQQIRQTKTERDVDWRRPVQRTDFRKEESELERPSIIIYETTDNVNLMDTACTDIMCQELDTCNCTEGQESCFYCQQMYEKELLLQQQQQYIQVCNCCNGNGCVECHYSTTATVCDIPNSPNIDQCGVNYQSVKQFWANRQDSNNFTKHVDTRSQQQQHHQQNTTTWRTTTTQETPIVSTERRSVMYSTMPVKGTTRTREINGSSSSSERQLVKGTTGRTHSSQRMLVRKSRGSVKSQQ